MLHAVLKVLSERQQGTVISLPDGRFLIGREEDCQLRPNSDLVSRHHCVFTTDDYTVRVRDLGSTNGTFVNGERLRGAVVLKTGDKVSVGKLEFEVVIGEPEAAAKAPAAPPEPDEAVSNDDTRTTAVGETLTEIPAHAQPGVPAMHDTAMYPQQPMPGFAPPYGYPQQQQFAQPQPYGYPGYPPQMYPGYYMPQYPQQGYPQQGYSQQPAPPSLGEADTPPPANSQSVPEVRLPDPETTGAKVPDPPAKPAEGASKTGNAANVPDMAANIIKQYLHRRPAAK